MLLIDIGNSCVKWGRLDGASLSMTGSAAYRDDPGPVIERAAARWPAPPARVWCVNVAGDAVGARLGERLRTLWPVTVEFVTAESAAGPVRNGYENWRLLGADRWLALVGAWVHCRGAACVIDVGTAVTIDFLHADGRHSGGFIVPGAALMARALALGTAGIGMAGDDEKLSAASSAALPGPGRNTAAAVSGGSLRAIVALIDNSFCLLRQQDPDARLVITGGGAAELAPLLAEPAELRPRLVLEGLAARACGQP